MSFVVLFAAKLATLISPLNSRARKIPFQLGKVSSRFLLEQPISP
jgi:hypothetical protein